MAEMRISRLKRQIHDHSCRVYGECVICRRLAACFSRRKWPVARIKGSRVIGTYIFLSIQCVEILTRGFLDVKIKMFSGLRFVCKPGKPEKEAQGTPDAEQAMHPT